MKSTSTFSLFSFVFFFLLNSSVKAYDEFRPGETWNDSKGVKINAHGACLIHHDNAYYWFGEDRNVFYSNGVSCYKSTDLYNWTKLGLALTPSGSKDPNGNDIAPGRTLERPKVVFNEATQKWVMWIHWENGEHYGDAKVAVATSDKIEGPYQFYKTFRPNGHDSRDQTLFVDTDGVGYHFGSTRMNSDMLISQLTENFLEVTGNEYYALVGKKYEAPAIFKVGDIYYGLFSGCTGWDPNPGHTAQTYEIMDYWTTGENFCVDKNKETSYFSQSTFVFKVPGYESAYIYMGDRWVPSNPGSSNVVWLPLSIRSGYPTVTWHDKWDLSVFKDVDRYKRAKAIDEDQSYLLLERNSNRFLSKTNYGLMIHNDNPEINLSINIIPTNKPYVYKIKEENTGKFFESIFGSLRINEENDQPSQEWFFHIQEDGYFLIENEKDNKYLAISGGNTYAESGVYLADKAKARAFSPYFDSKIYDYELADMYSLAYRDEIMSAQAEQKLYLQKTNLSNIKRDLVFQVSPTNNNGNFLLHTNTSIKNMSIEIIEASSGINVFKKDEVSNQLTISFHLEDILNSGVYLVKISTDQVTETKKIIVSQ